MPPYTPSILLISRHFPPHVSGGARRPFLFARGLKELGCKVTVVAPVLPSEFKGIVVPHANPTVAVDAQPELRVKSFLRECLLWPDPDIRWSSRAVEACLTSIDRPDWILTTSPPESVHVAGKKLKEKYKCQWAADFRDMWLDYPLRPARNIPARIFVERRQARSLCRNADVLIGVSSDVQAEINKFAFGKKVALVPQASPEISGRKHKFQEGTFNILHTGSFSLSDPNRSLLGALLEFQNAVRSFPQLHLHLAGHLTRCELNMLEKKDFRSFVSYHGVVNLEGSWAMQNGADALLVVGDSHEQSSPGKIAEYRASNKPLIAIGDKNKSMIINYNQNFFNRVEFLIKTEFPSSVEKPRYIYTERQAAEDLLKHMRANIGPIPA